MPRRSHPRLLARASLLLALACGGKDSPSGLSSPPAALATHTTATPTATVGTAVTPAPAVIVRDASNRPVPGVSVTFSIVSGAGTLIAPTQTTNSSGVATVGSWTLGTTAGPQRLRATVVDLTPVEFAATASPGAPASVAITAGTDQIARVGTQLPIAPAVRVRDEFDNLVAGHPVTFTVTRGAGTVTGGAATTSAQGIATVGGWTLGAAEGLNGLTVTAGDVPALEILAQAVPPSLFRPELRYLSVASPRYQLAFQRAVDRWRQVVIGDLADIPADVDANFCGLGEPALNETIDDVLIYVELGDIDGPGGTLGAAGPCAWRTANNLTVIGVMRFDTDDLADLESDGQLDAVILHEMGHVFGIGSLWSTFGLVSGEGSIDPYYIGPSGQAAFSLVGGDSYAGNKVPVENIGGGGTRDSHWRESVLRSELMTGYIQPPGVRMPLSLLTIGGLEDLGYTVSVWGNERFRFGTDLRREAAVAPRELREAPLPKAPVGLDAGGRPVAGAVRPAVVRRSGGRMGEVEPRPEQRMESRRP